MRGYFEACGTQGQGIASDSQGSSAPDDRTGEAGRGLDDVKGAFGYDRYNQCSTGDVCETLRTPGGGDNYPTVCYSVENHPADSRVSVDDSGKVQTLTSRMGTGGGNVPMVLEPTTYPGVGITSPLNKYNPQPGDPCHTLTEDSRNYLVYRYIVRRLTPTECARLQGFADRWGDIDEKTDFTEDEYQFWLNVRNTHAVINGKAVKDYTKPQMLTWYNKLHTDSAEYKLWGNGIALPPALYCMQGMVDALDKAVTDDWLL